MKEKLVNLFLVLFSFFGPLALILGQSLPPEVPLSQTQSHLPPTTRVIINTDWFYLVRTNPGTGVSTTYKVYVPTMQANFTNGSGEGSFTGATTNLTNYGQFTQTGTNAGSIMIYDADGTTLLGGFNTNRGGFFGKGLAWTNNANLEYVWFTGQPEPDDTGTLPGPGGFFTTRWELLQGTNLTQDIGPVIGSDTFLPWYHVSMVTSNEPSKSSWGDEIISDENYTFFSSFVTQARADIAGNAFYYGVFDSQANGGNRDSLYIGVDPNGSISGSLLPLSYRTNGFKIFGVDRNGTVTANQLKVPSLFTSPTNPPSVGQVVTYTSTAGDTKASIPALSSLGANSGSSANLAAALTDETGSGATVFGTSPTIITPTIASFVNANHNHQNAAGGGTLDWSSIATGAPVLYTGNTNIGNLTTSLVISIGHTMPNTNYVPSVSFTTNALPAVVTPSYTARTTTSFTLNLTSTGIAGGSPIAWSVIYSP